MKDHEGIEINTKLSSERNRILNRKISLMHRDKDRIKNENLKWRRNYISQCRLRIMYYGKRKKPLS